MLGCVWLNALHNVLLGCGRWLSALRCSLRSKEDISLGIGRNCDCQAVRGILLNALHTVLHRSCRSKEDILSEIRRLQSEMTALEDRVQTSAKIMGAEKPVVTASSTPAPDDMMQDDKDK